MRPPKKRIKKEKLSLKSILIYLTISHLTIITNHTIIKPSSKEQKQILKIYFSIFCIIFHKSYQYQSYYD